MIDGHPANISRRLRYVVRRAHKAGLVVTATRDGAHAPGSWHYSGNAVDLGFTGTDLRRLTPDQRRQILVAFQVAEYRRAQRLRFLTFKEILGPDNRYVVLKGRPSVLTEGTALETAHDNHVHVAR